MNTGTPPFIVIYVHLLFIGAGAGYVVAIALISRDVIRFTREDRRFCWPSFGPAAVLTAVLPIIAWAIISMPWR